ncbi:MAG TPA: tetratricopeptide repeat protein [Vicinamibacterales bacterium]|nr:tetratricopeptide repeat protein [Vicinamibacterales bacterium]
MNAEALRRSGNPQGAIDLCRDALARFPGHLSARVTLGWALLDLGQLKEAREEFEVVRKSAPDNFAAIRGLAQLHVLEESHAEAYSFDMETESAAPDDLEEPSPVAPPALVSPVVARLEGWLSRVEALRSEALTQSA